IIFLYFVLLLIPTFLSCSTTYKQIDIGRQIMSKFSRDMQNEHDLTMFGSGYRGSPSGNLSALVLTFVTEKKIDVKEARYLLLNICEQLLYQINASEEIRPWLTDVPFTGNNLDLRIGFNKENLKDVDPPYIASAYALKGKVYYSVSVNGMFKDVHEETYEEALKIYQEELCLKQPNTDFQIAIQ